MFWSTPYTPIAVEDWRAIAIFLLWFLVFAVLFWLIYFSIKPPFVLNSDNQVDVWLVVLAAAISALIVEIIVLLIKYLLGCRS